LPAELAAVHPVFQVSLLKKCVGDPTSIVPLSSVVVRYSLTYENVPLESLDRHVWRLRNKEVTSAKVMWRSLSIEGSTWEVEAAMKSKYPHLFPLTPFQLEAIVPLMFFNYSCVGSVLVSFSFSHTCIFSASSCSWNSIQSDSSFHYLIVGFASLSLHIQLV